MRRTKKLVANMVALAMAGVEVRRLRRMESASVHA